MFQDCSNLENVPNLPSEELAASCYYSMFYGCTSLTTIPENLLPATNLARNCYEGMFGNCESLQTAPALPAETLASHCYAKMFSGCIGLLTAPSLPATASEDNCYEEMFKDCPNINFIECNLLEISSYNCTTNWLSGVSSTGTFKKNASTTWIRGANGIPTGWTIEDITP